MIGRGITVDQSMTTSDPDILCIGDAAESPWGRSGLWPTVVHHAQAAVAQLTAQEMPAVDLPAPVRLKLEGIDVRSAGLIHETDGTENNYFWFGRGRPRVALSCPPK